MNVMTEVCLKRMLQRHLRDIGENELADSYIYHLRTVEMGITDGDASAHISAIGVPTSASNSASFWAVDFSREFDANGFTGIWNRLPTGEELLEFFEFDFTGVTSSDLVLNQDNWKEGLKPYMK